MTAADQLFFERGVDRSSTSHIARVAGVSIGALYRFFPNKDALVAEYVQRYLADLAGRIVVPLPEHIDLDQAAGLVDTLIDRSADVRRRFLGYSAVRYWRSRETGERPAQIVADAELSLVSSLFANSIYDLEPAHIECLSRVIVLATYPLLEQLPEVSEAEGEDLMAEVKLMLWSYIRASLEDAPLK